MQYEERIYDELRYVGMYRDWYGILPKYDDVVGMSEAQLLEESSKLATLLLKDRSWLTGESK